MSAPMAQLSERGTAMPPERVYFWNDLRPGVNSMTSTGKNPGCMNMEPHMS